MAVTNIDDAVKSMRGRMHEIESILMRHGIVMNPDEMEKQAIIFETSCTQLKKLKVAAIMDAFTIGNFKYECDLFLLDCTKWKAEMEEFRPDLVFIESAWNGKDNTWYKKVANGSKELYELGEYCRERGIPVVFWNKEDPVFTDVFMAAAACADYVFTTDIDCIERYKKNLQNDKVFLLHFGAQPVIHNPIELHDRKDKFCFAGAYYHRYKDRCRVFDSFADVFVQTKGYDIFDRNYKNARPEHEFPARYNSIILGSLKPSEIHIAYKGYNYGINMNSVSQSQSMFARRVFELLASNTVTVGNFSRGQRNFFGDLTVSTDDALSMQRQLEKYCGDDNTMRKYRLAGLRKVISQHLCEDRLGYIAMKVFGKDMKQPLPYVTVFAKCDTADDIAHVTDSFNKQTYKNGSLVIITDVDYTPADENIRVISTEQASADVSAFASDFAGAMSPVDYYGENYLYDLVLTARYIKRTGFGKVDFFENKDGEAVITDKSHTYKYCDSLFSTRGIIAARLVGCSALQFASGTDIRAEKLFCTDEFNYCKDGYAQSLDTVDDIYISDTGLDMHDLERVAEKIQVSKSSNVTLTLNAGDLYTICNKQSNRKVVYVISDDKFGIESKLGSDDTFYTEFAKNIRLSDFDIANNISVLCSGMGDLDTSLYCRFSDRDKKTVGSSICDSSLYLSSDIPAGSEYVTLAFRIKGTGAIQISEIKIGSNMNIYENMPFVSRSDTLVVTPRYPSYEDLYRYMFVHRRLKGYKEAGFNSDIMVASVDGGSCFREYDGINIVEGQTDRLMSVLENGRIKNVFVHFLDPYIWSILRPYTDSINLFIWSHGYDIQPWWRRKYNFTTDKEISEAKVLSADREEMWREVFKTAKTDNIRFVFVSEYLKNEVFEDYGITLEKNQYYVIHNCIDTALYSYEPKPAEQRFRILAVKSFDNGNYANDVMAKAIKELSNAPEFKDITIDIYGSGLRFDEDTAPVKRYRNVNLHKGYISPYEIAKLHKDHGIFLATTRMDTQGVSRDEAMSSGLVPVTNAAAAVPEFVTPDCGILAPPEDHKAIADGILKLVRDPGLFMKMSEAAAKHVRELSAESVTLPVEMKLAGYTEK